MLPSSHSSIPIVLLSPHISAHLLFIGAVESFMQAAPDSIIQSLLHPSPETRFPSSHCSIFDASIPSPHSVRQMSGDEEVPPEHTHPCSNTHIFEHPSSLILFPSSHFAPLLSKIIPSPQISRHVSFEVGDPPWHS